MDIDVPEGVESSEPFVQILDPALGTGTFLLRVIEIIHETMTAKYQDEGLDDEAALHEWVTYVRKHLLPRLNGFEIMMAPYIVSHLRLGLALQQTGFVFGSDDRLNVFLTNTLEMHTLAKLPWKNERVAEEGREAERIKYDAPISIIVGNPPYKLEKKADGAHKGGWVRDGWIQWRSGRPLLEDYSEPTTKAGDGGHLKNIYNLYVYFWRWASWRVFDRFNAPGIVSFITASSYLRGPGFGGMREEMRRAANEVFILDLEGDQKGTRITDNVFCITIPVCVGTLIANLPNREASSATRYYRLEGDKDEKLNLCSKFAEGETVSWTDISASFQHPMIGSKSSEYSIFPLITELFPWQHSGSQFKRTWPIACKAEVLQQRWVAFAAVSVAERKVLFRETKAWTIDSTFRPLLGTDPQPSLSSLGVEADHPRLLRYGFRSFDRHYAFADERLGDRLRPQLWQGFSESQVYLTSLLTKVLGKGPAFTASAFVPDMDYFCNRGGKDIIPLWRDAEATEANICDGFSQKLRLSLDTAIRPMEIFAYAYAVMANPGYVQRFEDELQVPGPRLPITKDLSIFKKGVEFGTQLLQWHTFGERLTKAGFELQGTASVITAIPESSDAYPEKHKYDAKRKVICVGDGEIGPVAEEVWNFSVSGLQVVKSWLKYRMKKGAGRKSSPLDDIRPESWTAEMTRELLELLWVLEWTIAKYPELDLWLDEVLASELFTADEIPSPTDAERKAPKVKRQTTQINLLGNNDE